MKNNLAGIIKHCVFNTSLILKSGPPMKGLYGPPYVYSDLLSAQFGKCPEALPRSYRNNSAFV